MPPSAMSGMFALREAFAQLRMAVICGIPPPLITRVVQIDPGPIPDRVPACGNQILCRLSRGNVADDQIHFGELGFVIFS